MVKKILLILISLILLAGCAKKEEEKPQIGCDTDNHGCEISNVTDDVLKYRELITKFSEISYDEAYKRISNGGSLIIYYGFETCPWCQELLPILAEYADDNEIFYVNMKPDSEDSRLPGHKDYDSYLKNYELINKFEEVDKIYAPTIVEASNSELIKVHAGTVEGHNAKERKMTDEERQQLKDIIADFFVYLNGEVK